MTIAMARWLVPTILLSLLGGCAHTAHPSSSSGGTALLREQETGIQVVGQGKVDAEPDLAVFRVGVEARQKSVDQAREAAARAQQAVLEALQGAGVQESDIQTTAVTVAPDFVYSERGRQLKGYVVRNQVQVRMRDIAKVGEALDAAMKAGGDRVRLDGLSFEVSEPEAVEAEARKKAMEHARAKARQLAELLGVKLGGPIEVEETSAAPPRPVAMRLEAQDERATRTPIQPGTTEVEVQLRVRWAIQP